ncbi:hypothetical protein [Aliarcobacter cryaerophilus]|jgi:hypothetical protein|uniref:hypothetical protein n=1 Tax=Aliarcobacter cryaerophilus TaxID=28198 RepID=UPI000EB4BE9E|nr:hypothetical protein [Aliarcobacter cryaerophilus]AYJ78184.1 putative membrane protein [Aliarcobacter cryaerophilus D2610]
MLKKLAKKTKVLGVVAAATVLTTASQAAVTYDAATKTLTGDVDMGAYNSAIPIIIGVMSITIAVGLMLSLFARARKG